MSCDNCLDDLRDLILACDNIAALRGYITEVMERLCAQRCSGQLTTPGLDPVADPGDATVEGFPTLPTCDCALLVLRDTNDKLYLSADNGVSWIRIPDTRHNIAATDPTVNDDSGDGYTISSRWINTASGTEWVCVDATLGAAVWVQTTNITPTPPAMVEIASDKLLANAANIDITGIPQTYHDLVLVARLRCSAASADVNVRFNGDSGTNYAVQSGLFAGGAASAARTLNQTSAIIPNAMASSAATAAYFNGIEIRIPGYYRDDITKVAQYEGTDFTSDTVIRHIVGSIGWENIANGINQITLTPASGNFLAGSSWVLYGRGEAL